VFLIEDPNGQYRMDGIRMRRMHRREIRNMKRLWALCRVLRESSKIGRALGYPPCCIQAFQEFSCVPSSFDGSGFRACAACAERPHREVWREIHARRSVPWPLVQHMHRSVDPSTPRRC
jgi:hypothetical protein